MALNLSGLFKEVYGDDVQDLVPEVAKLTKRIPFASADKQEGGKFVQAVILSGESGITMSPADSGSFALQDPVSMTIKQAQINGVQMLLRSSLSYEEAARASTSKKAFEKATSSKLENMMESATKRLEILILHGQSGLATIASSANSSATKTVLTVTPAQFAAGIWAGSKDHKLNAYDHTGALISSGVDSVFAVASVDAASRKITVTGSSAGISALDSAISGHADACSLYFNGSKDSEFAGIKKILTNTGTLFNIDASVYDAWKGQTYSAASGALTYAKVQQAVAQAVSQGLNEDVLLVVNPTTWSNLNGDQAILRQFDSSYDSKESKQGSEGIKFFSQNGAIEVMSHSIVKEGEAFLFPVKRVKRVGSTDLTFKFPGSGDDMVLNRPEHAAHEMRLYTAQAILIETPNRCVYIKDIVNS